MVYRVLLWIGGLVWASTLPCKAFESGTPIVEQQLTTAPHGHILTNTGVWSHDSEWIVYDIRSDPAGDVFDGTRIERVHVPTGRIEVLYEAKNNAHCGVATCSPIDPRVVFIHGPEQPTSEWSYAAHHRRGVIVDANRPGTAHNLDARNIVAPFTPGALRGGTHVHTFSGDGQWVAFTYEDHVLQALPTARSPEHDLNQRNVGVSISGHAVTVPKSHPRNHDGSHFTVLATKTSRSANPRSDGISRAFSDAWIGKDGYQRSDGSHQAKAIAFQGTVTTDDGDEIAEVFVVDLPNDMTSPSPAGPLQGTATLRPQPPNGVVQRRLTFTADRAHPGIQGVRHWLRSSPDGSRIACLMKSDAGISQLWLVSPNGGAPEQLTHNAHPIASAFSWSPDGSKIAHVMDQSVCVTLVGTGETVRLTAPRQDAPLRPEACVFSPDGAHIAYVRQVKHRDGNTWNQIFVIPSTPEPTHD